MSATPPEIWILVDEDAHAARIRIPESFDPSFLGDETLQDLARAEGVVVDEDEAEALERIRQAFIEQPRDVDEVFATAELPEPGDDGEVLWAARFDPQHRHQETADGAADHYAGDTRRVHQGDRVATVVPPGDGAPGRDVRGGVIEAAPGRPAPVEFDPQTFEIGEDGVVVAAAEGVLRVEDGFCSIADLLEIDGGVDFSTGHVETSGSVHVGEGVKDHFRIDADKDVSVQGLVEGATIVCKGDLHLAGGMAARDLGGLDVQGDTHAEFLNSVSGVIGGDLYVRREILKCHLRVGGALHGARVTVIGGELKVSGAVELETLGSRSETPTRLVVGLPAPGTEFAETVERLQRLESEIAELEEEQAALLARASRLTAGQKQRRIDLESLLSERRAARAEAAARADELRQESAPDCVVDVKVRGMIHPRVSIATDQQEITLSEPVQGPVEFRWSQDRRLMARRGGGGWTDAQEIGRAAAA